MALFTVELVKSCQLRSYSWDSAFLWPLNWGLRGEYFPMALIEGQLRRAFSAAGAQGLGGAEALASVTGDMLQEAG